MAGNIGVAMADPPTRYSPHNDNSTTIKDHPTKCCTPFEIRREVKEKTYEVKINRKTVTALCKKGIIDESNCLCSLRWVFLENLVDS